MIRGKEGRIVLLGALLAVLLVGGGTASAQTLPCERVITADVVALDQVQTYNRFGAFNPLGVMYALKRDVVAIDSTQPKGPGNVRLRSDKRPRPLVLRANVGDCLDVTFTNWLVDTRPVFPGTDHPFCDTTNVNDELCVDQPGPMTRSASMHVNGLQFDPQTSDGSWVGYNNSTVIDPHPTQSIQYRWYADKEGAFLIYSHGALAGGEGDGGNLVLGLFGALNVEPRYSKWFRSQLTEYELGLARNQVCQTVCDPPDVEEVTASTSTQSTYQQPAAVPGNCHTTCWYEFDYAAIDPQRGNEPAARILNDSLEIVHSDLNAIIDQVSEPNCVNGELTVGPPSGTCGNFREFTVIFHDELKTVQAFEALERDPTFHGVRDGFGINYGASGMGAILLANFNGVGPAAECDECKYEEFFLESWANGDPALLPEYSDDPSNIHHSYLGDPVKFRNIHAGPKETHVFHLHAHQWLHEENGENSTYLDSQTVGPGSAFTYEINYGGSGNRNLSVGDSIFHCHLYPHFAQGMWELWRTHDVFEDGSVGRNLPDGLITAGTRNPAVLPMPGRALAPLPTGQFPGYPFYIGDQTGLQGAIPGRRSPTPPLDLEFDGGLPRHVIVDAEMYKGRRGVFDKELKKPDGTVLPAELRFLPQAGTPKEIAAQNFHAVRNHPSRKPDGTPGTFVTNGLPPTGGAPFAEPCDPQQTTDYRHYRVAAIEIDLEVNDEGWHDPQARIDVLNDDIESTINKTRATEPFFFRANSGECVNFFHTNLIPGSLEADPFQIFTPTDTIGQHIHLVKFDVTSSDGSGNGFNYEDGTFAPEEVIERIHAYNKWLDNTGSTDPHLIPQQNPATSRPEGLGAQTTIQRWWADPLLNQSGNDRTIRTVFTHDHFAPSSIQHHGFYGALVVEPAGSTWWDPNPNGVGQLGVRQGPSQDGGPTLFRADIHTGDLDGDGKNDSFREFNLAFADFAIVFDRHGDPVNKPAVPEAISSDDPGTMLINYRNEPVPIRISKSGAGVEQRGGPKGDMAYAFSSRVHGDPATPILPVYEGDRVKMRLIQGAQEEQHVFTLNGMRWPHEPSDPKSGWTAAQAIGISEHFEFVSSVPASCPPAWALADSDLDELAYDTFTLLDPDPDVTIDDPTELEVAAALADRLGNEIDVDVTFEARLDDAVNRIFTDAALAQALKDGESTESFYSIGAASAASYEASAIASVSRRERCFSDYLYGSMSLDDTWNGMWGIMRSYRDPRSNLRQLPSNPRPNPVDDFAFNVSPAGMPSLPAHPDEPSPCTGNDSNGNPRVVTGYRTYSLVAMATPITYNASADVTDPSGLIFVPEADWTAVRDGLKAPEPLVIRAAAGECLTIKLRNRLPGHVPDRTEDAELPNIVKMNVDDLKPSRRVSLHPQLVDVNIRRGDGTAVGFNPDQTVRRNKQITYRWYVPLDLSAPRDPGSILVAGPESLGGTNLRDFGDIIKHGSQGLFGGLILEPVGATFSSDYGATADITTPAGNFREFVVLFQDGLNLRDTNGNRVPDMPGNAKAAADADPEDQGSKAFNYKTEPFWVRLCDPGAGPQNCVFQDFDLNDEDQTDVLSSSVHGDPATPVFEAEPGQAIRFRLLQPDGRARQHSFALHGHEWSHEPDNPGSMTLGAQAGMSVARHFNIHPLYGAGGIGQFEGDYLYRDMGSFMFSGGLWGILRVAAPPPPPPPPPPCKGCPNYEQLP